MAARKLLVTRPLMGVKVLVGKSGRIPKNHRSLSAAGYIRRADGRRPLHDYRFYAGDFT